MAATSSGFILSQGSFLASGSDVGSADPIDLSEVTLTRKLELKSDLILWGNSVVASNSLLASGSVLTSDSLLGGGAVFDGSAQLSYGLATVQGGKFNLRGATTLGHGSVLAEYTLMHDPATMTTGSATLRGNSTLVVAGDTRLAQGSFLAENSQLGSSFQIGGRFVVAEEAKVEGKDMRLAADSFLAAGSVIVAGTHTNADLFDAQGNLVAAAGTILQEDMLIGAQGESGLVISHNMDLPPGSIIAAGSELEPGEEKDWSDFTKSADKRARLADVKVTNQQDAQLAITVADAALTDLNRIRSGLGSVQNQLTSTIANITITRVNLEAAESGIRDVDFSDETANFSKFQILTQAGSFAMTQANATGENVLSLLQG